MEVCKGMEREITRIAHKHGFDLAAPETHLRLTNGGYMPLVIEKLSEKRISVCHYHEQNGDLCQDPEIVFFMTAAGWIPIEITQPSFMLFGREMGGYRTCAGLNADGDAIVGIKPLTMKSVAALARTWSTNLHEQGWYKNAIKDES